MFTVGNKFLVDGGVGDTLVPPVKVVPEMFGGRGGFFGGTVPGGARSVRVLDVLELVLEVLFGLVL
eukprot:2835929-Heterocapsa_arctica.AAC.1